MARKQKIGSTFWIDRMPRILKKGKKRIRAAK
jgi:hypothetical protein